MEVTEEGMKMDSRDSHPWKAPNSMEVTDGGISIDFRDVQK